MLFQNATHIYRTVRNEMLKKIGSGLMLTMLLVGISTSSLNIQPVNIEPGIETTGEAQPKEFDFGTVYVKSTTERARDFQRSISVFTFHLNPLVMTILTKDINSSHLHT